MKTGEKILVSKPLKEYEAMLDKDTFVRPHNSYLVNINEITRYYRGKGGYLVMKDGSIIPVSRQKKNDILDALQYNTLK